MTVESLAMPNSVDASPNGMPARVHPRFRDQEPTWEIAYFFPAQGSWTEMEYLDLDRICGDRIRVELTNGRLEFLPMPTEIHQSIIGFLLGVLQAFVGPARLGKASFSGIRVRVRDGLSPKYREPDIAFMKTENALRRHNEYWEGADLVMEIVSGDPADRARDYVAKVKEYAEAGIAEYWIVDPDEQRIRILTLVGSAYQLHGDFLPGANAAGALLPEFAVAVNDVLAAGRE